MTLQEIQKRYANNTLGNEIIRAFCFIKNNYNNGKYMIYSIFDENNVIHCAIRFLALNTNNCVYDILNHMWKTTNRNEYKLLVDNLEMEIISLLNTDNTIFNEPQTVDFVHYKPTTFMQMLRNLGKYTVVDSREVTPLVRGNLL